MDSQVRATYRVSAAHHGLRLDRFLKTQIPRMSRTGIQDAIRTRVAVRDRGQAKPSRMLRAGDVVEVWTAIADEPPFPDDLVPAVLHLDPDLIAVDKPAGLAVHSSRKVLRNHLIGWLRARYGDGTALAHRLDRETSGVVLVTRGREAARALGRDFARGRVHKEYLAIVCGLAPERFEVSLPVGPDRRSPVHVKQAAGVAGGAAATTRFVRERHLDGLELSLVRAFPETGRRHQIRVHLAAAGFPVLGDKLYRDERHFLDFVAHGLTPRLAAALGADRQMLHAAAIEIRHPADGRPLRIEAPPPADFARLLDPAACG